MHVGCHKWKNVENLHPSNSSTCLEIQWNFEDLYLHNKGIFLNEKTSKKKLKKLSLGPTPTMGIMQDFILLTFSEVGEGQVGRDQQ